MKNVSEVEHDTIPYARFFPQVLSLRASLTLTANTFLLPVRGGRDLRPHRVGISPSHSDSRDQAQKEAGQKRKDTPGPPCFVILVSRRLFGQEASKGLFSLFGCLRHAFKKAGRASKVSITIMVSKKSRRSKECTDFRTLIAIANDRRSRALAHGKEISGPSGSAWSRTESRRAVQQKRAEQRVRKRRDRPDPLGGEADARGRRVGKARTNPRPASTIWQG